MCGVRLKKSGGKKEEEGVKGAREGSEVIWFDFDTFFILKAASNVRTQSVMKSS